MSSNDKKFLTEVDKMIMKLDDIIIAIKGEEGVINYKNVKDGFERLRFEINDELKTVETLLNDREKILNSTVPKEIFADARSAPAQGWIRSSGRWAADRETPAHTGHG